MDFGEEDVRAVHTCLLLLGEKSGIAWTSFQSQVTDSSRMPWGYTTPVTTIC